MIGGEGNAHRGAPAQLWPGSVDDVRSTPGIAVLERRMTAARGGQVPGSRVGCGREGRRARRRRATSATRSTVKPNFSKIVPAGAEAPKWSSPMIAPSSRPSAPSPARRRPRPIPACGPPAAGPLSRYACVLRLEPLPARQRHDPRRDAVAPRAPRPRRRRAGAPSPSRSGSAAASPPGGLAQDVAAAAEALAGLLGRARERRQLLAGEGQRDRPGGPSRRRSTASAQAAAASLASPGRTNHRFGIARSAA